MNKLLDTAQPSVEFTRRKYVEAHGAIVASAAYTRALETAAQVLHKVSAIGLFHAAPACCDPEQTVDLSVKHGREARKGLHDLFIKRSAYHMCRDDCRTACHPLHGGWHGSHGWW